MNRYRYKITNDNKAKIVSKLQKEGIAYWELAVALGCHENTVARIIRNASEDDVERILEVADEIAAAHC